MRHKKALNMTTAEPSVVSRNSFINKIGLTGLACALFLMPWPVGNALEDNSTRLGTRGESKHMTLAQQSTQRSPADYTIPSIDAVAPAVTETATFALG